MGLETSIPTERCPICGAPRDIAKQQMVFPVPEYNKVGTVDGLDRWVQCGSCAVCYRVAMPTVAELDRYYREEYRDPAYPTLHDRAVQLSRADRIVRYTQQVRGNPGRTLDFGCSTGTLLDEVRREWGVEVIGVELNPTDHAVAAEKGIKVYDYLDDVPGMFDTVYMAHVLEHFTDPIGFLRGLKQHVNPGGEVLLEMPAPMANGAWADFHMTCWPSGVIHQAFLNAGWLHVNVSTTREYPLVYWAAGRKPDETLTK